MATVHFTRHLESHVDCRPASVAGATVHAALDEALAKNPAVRNYILDDQNRLRRHIMVFVDGRILEDRIGLSDPVKPDSEIYVMQALSGG